MRGNELTYQLVPDRELNEIALKKGVFIAVIHATRIPPHIGLIIAGKYHSLSVKGQDLNIPADAFVRNSNLRKIPCLFIKLKSHSTFSDDYLSEHFIENVKQFRRVDVGVATCLSPIRLFFEETYGISMERVNYLYELLPVLEAKGLIEYCSSLNIDRDHYELPVYSQKEIEAGITQVRNEYQN
ncbi:MAG: hypothetical protein ACJ77K_03655 [Bacteroidia bacterium]|jgi:hypothetical protein